MRLLLVLFAVAVAARPRGPAPRTQESPPPGFSLRLAPEGGRTHEVTAHAEHAAFALREGEALHPEAAAAGFTASFAGELRIVRPGRYRFTLDVEGGAATIAVRPPGAGVESRAAGAAPSAAVSTGWIACAAGTAQLRVEFRRDGGSAARLRTEWEQQPDDFTGGFRSEPVPARVVRVPAADADAVRRDLAARDGRVRLTELGCVNCHAAGDRAARAVESRAPIALARVAARSDEGWLRRWLVAPQSMKPGCGMPDLLGDGAGDRARLDDLVELLEAIARDPDGRLAPPVPDLSVDPSQSVRGRELFHSVGCIGCHGALESPAAAFADDSAARELPGAPPPAPWGDLAGKWRAGELAAFLRDPAAVRTHGRMPSLGLDEHDAAAIAHYLAGWFGAAAAPAATRPPDVGAVERGRAAFEAIGCGRCHTLGGGLDAAGAEARPLDQLDPARGCLAEEGSRGKAPRYRLDEAARAELRAGLESLRRASGAPAPLDAAQRALAAFQCGACHERGGRGGAPDPLLAYFKCRDEADLGDEGRLPPPLDGVGLRLQSPWLAQVIAGGARARPYLESRMPRFGEAAAAPLVDGLAAIEGEWRSDVAAAAPDAPAEERATLGRRLAGSGGFNCITCHSFGDRPSAGTPGLDFTQFAARIRRDWWRRYAHSPLRFKPGTRMPTYFDRGTSAVTTLLDGDAGAQIDALWDWFEQARSMPAPEGVPSGQRMVLDVGDRPKVFRTFLARAGSRGIAVGWPQGLHFAFDAEQIRLCEAWRGEFLDVAPVWTGRGGSVAPQLGEVAWSAPPGPALLLEPPSGAWPADSGRNHGLKFRGYRLEPDGAPVFLWELRKAGTPQDEPPQPDAVQVEESFVPDARRDVLFVRTLKLSNLPRAGSLFAEPFGEKAADVRVENGELVPLEVEGSVRALELRPGDRSRPLVVRIEFAP